MLNKLTINSAAMVFIFGVAHAGCSCEKKETGHTQPLPAAQVVPEEQLRSILPQLSGWTAQGVKATHTDDPKVSRVSAAYEKKVDEQTWMVNLEVIDAINDRSVFDPLAVMAHSEPNAEIGHKRGIEVQGYHGIEAWNVRDVSVVLALVVENRFLVRLTGSHVPEAVVKEWIQATDLKKLASLVGSAAKQN